jgi:DNA-binding winged helix-turn-helix (wHTH) protein/Tol biopolymer transport system component
LRRDRLRPDDSAVDRNASAIQFGLITLVPGERVLLKDGRPVALTPKAFDLLAYMAANPRRLLTKDELMREVWPDAVVEESNLASNVFAIRKALGEGGDGERYIETVSKRGYRFIAPVQSLPVDSPSRLDSGGKDGAADGERRTPSDHGEGPAIPWRWIYAAAGLTIGALVVSMLPQNRAAHTGTSLPSYFQETAWDRHEGTGVGTLYPFPVTRAPLSVSPDGQHLAIAMAGKDAVPRLWIRRLSDRVPQALTGTETAFIYPFFWSPDSTAIAFDATGAGGLKAVGLAGGAPQTVCDLPGSPIGGSWNQRGVIIVGQALGPITKCPAGGGVATPVTLVAAGEREAHLFPSFLPDGRHFIYLAVSWMKPERSGIYVTALDDRSPGAGKRLLTTGFMARYVPAIDSRPGLLVFGRDGALFAQRFDDRRLELVGEPIQLADRVATFLDGADFSASPTTLVYRPPDAPLQLTWFDREGRSVGRVGSPEHMTGFDLSPDGERAIVARYAPLNSFDQDLWLYTTLHETNPRRLTSAPMLEFFPRWVNNERFVFTSGEIYEQAVSSERELLTSTTDRFWPVPSSVSVDGGLTLYSQLRDPKTGVDVWVHARRGDQAADAPLLTGAGNQEQAQISPDGRWVAYVSNESGPNEVFVAESRIDPATSRLTIREGAPVSKGGGFAPRWRTDGRELFYRKADGSVMVIATNDGSAFSPRATTRLLFAVPGALPDWGVTPNGRRFLFAMPVSGPQPYQIVRDWQALLSN